MKKIFGFILVVCCITLCVSCGGDNKKGVADNNVSNETRTSTETVFVCNGGHATKYHCNRNCSGLGNCRGAVVEMTEDQAQGMGRTRCKKCY